MNKKGTSHNTVSKLVWTVLVHSSQQCLGIFQVVLCLHFCLQQTALYLLMNSHSEVVAFFSFPRDDTSLGVKKVEFGKGKFVFHAGNTVWYPYQSGPNILVSVCNNNPGKDKSRTWTLESFPQIEYLILSEITQQGYHLMPSICVSDE